MDQWPYHDLTVMRVLFFPACSYHFIWFVIPGVIESVSAVEGKGCLFHGVLVVEWTDVAFCLSFVACRSVHIKNSSRLRYGKVPVVTTRRP